jgi:hypothetical protein
LRGGAVANIVSHPASIILELVKPLEEVKVLAASRNLKPDPWPDLYHVAVRSDQVVGSFTVSVGHGNADRKILFLFEGGCSTIDLVRQVRSTMQGTFPLNFLKKASSGIDDGLQRIAGVLTQALGVVLGHSRRNPGLFNIVEDFYKSIHSQSEPLVSFENVLAVTKLVETMWGASETEVGVQDFEQAS